MSDTDLDAQARRLLADHGLAGEPPIDVELLASRLGVDAIAEADLVEDGRLEVDRSSVRILLRGDLTPSRRRYTIAHEIAHLVLEAPASAPVTHQRSRGSADDVERLCDEFAASLLLPGDLVAGRFGSRPRNLSTIRHLAHVCETSLAAATVRLREVAGWQESLLCWRGGLRSWSYAWEAGVPPDLHGRLRSGPETSRQLDACGGRDRRVQLQVVVAGRERSVSAQVSRRQTVALALADLRRPS